MLLPRYSYLPLVTEKVKRNFQRSISQKPGDEMWFDYDDDPLKWYERGLENLNFLVN
jgi:autophagy-related protein 5